MVFENKGWNKKVAKYINLVSEDLELVRLAEVSSTYFRTQEKINERING